MARINNPSTHNTGSSSIKLRLLDANDVVVRSLDLGTEGLRDRQALEETVGESEIDAVGHRVVHGGELTSQSTLSQLNGGEGVRRGMFRITDRAGNTAVIDTTAAVSLDDVIKKINTSLDVSVKAEAFEGLLEKAASEGKKGAGQYFTPRALIAAIPRDENRQYHTADVIRLIAPAASVIEIPGPTSGAACTALLAIEGLGSAADEAVAATPHIPRGSPAASASGRGTCRRGRTGAPTRADRAPGWWYQRLGRRRE